MVQTWGGEKLIYKSWIFLVYHFNKPDDGAKAYTMLTPISAKKKGLFFQWEARIREIEKKKRGGGVFFRHQSVNFFLKRVEFCISLFPLFVPYV